VSAMPGVIVMIEVIEELEPDVFVSPLSIFVLSNSSLLLLSLISEPLIVVMVIV